MYHHITIACVGVLLTFVWGPPPQVRADVQRHLPLPLAICAGVQLLAAHQDRRVGWTLNSFSEVCRGRVVVSCSNQGWTLTCVLSRVARLGPTWNSCRCLAQISTTSSRFCCWCVLASDHSVDPGTANQTHASHPIACHFAGVGRYSPWRRCSVSSTAVCAALVSKGLVSTSQVV